MITKEKIREFITLNRELGSSISFPIIESDVLYDTEKLYHLYYGDGDKINLGKYYHNISERGEIFEITDDNLSEVVDRVYEDLKDSIAKELHATFEKFGWEYEMLKYFDDEPKKYERFKKEVLRLKEESLNGL